MWKLYIFSVVPAQCLGYTAKKLLAYMGSVVIQLYSTCRPGLIEIIDGWETDKSMIQN